MVLRRTSLLTAPAVAVTALTKGRIALCLVAVGAQEVRGVVQPGAGVTIAVPVVLWRTASIAANIVDGCLQGVQEIRQGGVERWLASIRIQPAAGFAKVTAAATLILVVEISSEMAIGEINLAFDQPARVLEQGHDVSSDRSCAGARQSGHRQSIGRLKFPLEHLAWIKGIVRGFLAALDPVTGNHVVVTKSGADHRVDASIAINDNFEEGRPLKVHEFTNHGGQVALVVEAPGKLEAIGLGSFDKILAVQGLVAPGHAAAEVQFLPLAHHAVAVVVEYDDFDRCVVRRRGFKLTDIHPNTAIAVDVDDNPVGARKLCADSRGQAESHRAHAARCQPETWATKIEILSCPHLMLADARRNYRFAL